jgi:hypothetical protein
MLPFTPEQFLAVFVNCNNAIWPIQIAAYLLGGIAVALLFRKVAADALLLDQPVQHRGSPSSRHFLLSYNVAAPHIPMFDRSKRDDGTSRKVPRDLHEHARDVAQSFCWHRGLRTAARNAGCTTATQLGFWISRSVGVA